MKYLSRKLLSRFVIYLALPCFLIACIPKKESPPTSVSKIDFSQTLEVGGVVYFVDEFLLFSYPTKSEVRAIISTQRALTSKPFECLEASFSNSRNRFKLKTEEVYSYQESKSLKLNEIGLVWVIDDAIEQANISITSIGFCKS